MKDSTGKALSGFIFGAAIGVAAGLLFAPRSGEETRKRLQDKAKEYTDDVTQKLSDKIDNLREHVTEAGEEVKSKTQKVGSKTTPKTTQ